MDAKQPTTCLTVIQKLTGKIKRIGGAKNIRSNAVCRRHAVWINKYQLVSLLLNIDHSDIIRIME